MDQEVAADIHTSGWSISCGCHKLAFMNGKIGHLLKRSKISYLKIVTNNEGTKQV